MHPQTSAAMGESIEVTMTASGDAEVAADDDLNILLGIRPGDYASRDYDDVSETDTCYIGEIGGEEVGQGYVHEDANALCHSDHPRIRRRYRYIALLLLALSAIIIGLVFLLTPNDNKSKNQLESVEGTNDEVGGSSKPEDKEPPVALPPISMDEECPVNTSAFSVRYDWKERMPNVLDADGNDDAYTWALRDGCSGELIAQCQPCPTTTATVINVAVSRSNINSEDAHRKLSSNSEDSRDVQEEEEKKDAKQHEITSRECLPPGKDYILEVRSMTKEEKVGSSCCGLSNPFQSSFESMYNGDVVVVMYNDGVHATGAGSTWEDYSNDNSFCDKIESKKICRTDARCRYDSKTGECLQALNKSSTGEWNVRFGEMTGPCQAGSFESESSSNSSISSSQPKGPTSKLPTGEPVTSDMPDVQWLPSPNQDRPSKQPTAKPVTEKPTSSTTFKQPIVINDITDVQLPPSANQDAVTAGPLITQLFCPPLGVSVSLTSETKYAFAHSTANTFCGIFIQNGKKRGSTLIPYARSYNGEEWEASPGPNAIRSKDITCSPNGYCAIHLPALADGANDSYILLAKDGFMEDRKQIAKFLEMTTFGPKKEEINALDDGAWGPKSRAQYVRRQMDTPATSHREYFRKRANAKVDSSTMVARSDHPCNPNSLWRKYTFIKQDVYMNDGSHANVTLETVPEEADFEATLYEADRTDSVLTDCGKCEFVKENSASGIGYYNFAGKNDFIEWSIQMERSGTYPLSFRFSLGSRYNTEGYRQTSLYVNDELIEDSYPFGHTGGWKDWMYSETVNVSLDSGSNKIRLVLADGGGPNIDHLRIGKPPSVAIKVNGWARTIVKDGVGLLSKWNPKQPAKDQVEELGEYPQPPKGGLYRTRYGSTTIRLYEKNKPFEVDIGNPPIFFTGYEQYLPEHYFQFGQGDVFTDAGSQLYDFPIQEGQELRLRDGLTDPICDHTPPFASENDGPVFGLLPSGEWLQWTPTILLEDNGPSINASSGDKAKHTLSDGGGSNGGIVRCANAPRSFVNEDTCFLSTDTTACSNTKRDFDLEIHMTTANIATINSIGQNFVYAIRGLGIEDINQHPCLAKNSRWIVETGACDAPTRGLGAKTLAALEDAIKGSSDDNVYVRDVSHPDALSCNEEDINIEILNNLRIQVGTDCYTHVHPDHLNVYDFSDFAGKHPGGKYHIRKWAQNDGWYIDYPLDGNVGIPNHPMYKWRTRVQGSHIDYVTRLGDKIPYADLPNGLRTNRIGQYFEPPHAAAEGGAIVCGSIGEIGNDPAYDEVFDIVSNGDNTSTEQALNNQKQVVWTEVNLFGNDQLRQRMAWALAQIITTVPNDITDPHTTEKALAFYDIFVRHAFSSYRDILRQVSFSPIMAEQLSYLQSKSHSYTYSMKKRISMADENYAREIMQLFTIGLVELNDDGSLVVDANGKPRETYTNEDIESFATAWTGFEKSVARGNIEGYGKAGSDIDPMQIIEDWRDPFPKSNLDGGFIGDRYVLCQELPDRSFLKKGAHYRLLGGNSNPELMKDPEAFNDDDSTASILRAELDPSSQLYQRLYNEGDYELAVELENDLNCFGIECEVDTFRVVKVGAIFYEFVQRPCVQMSFYDNGKQIQYRRWSRTSAMCANPNLAHAREACCWKEGNKARLVSGVTHLYDGERMKFSTAKNRCVEDRRDLCVFRSITVAPKDQLFRKGYHWTSKDCTISVKVNSEGYVAIVHEVDLSGNAEIPDHVEGEQTLNWFRVFWNGDGKYPGSSEANDCAEYMCETTADGSCLCKTTVAESTVFEDVGSVSKADVMSQLFIGALGPRSGSVPTAGNGFIAHIVGNSVDEYTVFEVVDYGRTYFLKNVRSIVSLAHGIRNVETGEVSMDSTSPSFRNPPHFMSLISDMYWSNPQGIGEQTLRDAQYETDAVIDHYFYHKNTAPFLCTRIMQRFGFSNPSPRYVRSCVEAFRSGSYFSGDVDFGSGDYGSLEAMVAAILLSKEATEPSLLADPSYGSIREPMLKVIALMRSMEYNTKLPTFLYGPAMSKSFPVRLKNMVKKIGQSPYEFPTIFSFFLPEYVTDSGPTLQASLVSPEAMLVTMPNTLQLLSGMWSLIKYGLSDCDGGFSAPSQYADCIEDGQYKRSYGRLFYEPDGLNFSEEVDDIALLLTMGRLSDSNHATIVSACVDQPDKASRTRCVQQLIVATGEFHSTNHVTHSGDNRNSRAVMDDSSSEPYKALVYLYLEGGVDSYNMLAPYHCAPIDVHERYLTIRGKTSKDDGIGLPLDQMLEIPSNNPNQPCTSFGIHEKLGVLKNLYQHTLFIANAGLLSKPVTVADYKADMDVQLFSHNSMLLETHKDDVESEYLGTGVGGRLADVLTEAGIATSLFSIKGQQIFLSGEEGLAQYILSSEGLEAFNENPSINNMTGVIMALNNATSADSGYFAETYSSKVSDSISQYQLLKKEFDNAETSVEFPDSDIANQLKIVTQLMKSASVRRSKRDIFYVSHVGYDDHRRVVDQLNKNFVEINAAIEAFVDELKALQLWESTVILQFSEFGRTLSPNTGDGSDHGWGGNHFMLGGSVKGGAVLGQYPDDFEESRSNNIALRRGRLIPTTPWDAMLKGTAEWFGVGSSDMDKVLPMHKNFPPELIYGKDDLFVNDLEPAS